ncbi:hypothetical protein IV503_30545 [Klebsiella huaxiensis]|uniref:hypothetical protein n=1 Tax=Klebsiella huaxiensis TaxID=2153354 RepID=UPI002F3448FF
MNADENNVITWDCFYPAGILPAPRPLPGCCTLFAGDDFLLESPVLLDGNLDGNILALNGGYPAENQSAFTSTA